MPCVAAEKKKIEQKNAYRVTLFFAYVVSSKTVS